MGFVLDLDKKYVVLPYTDGATPREVGFYKENGEIVTSLLLEYDDSPDDWVYLPSSLFGEKRVCIHGDADLKKLVRTEDEKKGEGSHYAFHYAPSFGWINDPNGLHYRDGLYHLYYQMNPVSKRWNNRSWGHAVSRDMVSFEEKDPVFLPKSDSLVIFSGSALNGEFAYTVANVKGERSFYQERRFSEDGYSFGESEVIIPCFSSEERDPRLFEYKGSKYLLLWVKGNTYALFVEKDGKYTIVNTFEAKDAWECPDIYNLDGRLFFSTADGFYFEAEIDVDGLKLIGERKEMFLTKIPYASQSFTGLEDTYMVSWLRVETPHLRTTGAMSIIRKVCVNGDNLVLEPNRDLLACFRENGKYRNQYSNPYAVLRLETCGSFSGDIGGTEISFDCISGVLKFGEEEVTFTSPKKELDIFLDHEILEISDREYRNLAVFEIKMKNDYYSGVRLSSSDLGITEYVWRK